MEAQHSVLLPGGTDAETIATLSWIMFGGATAIFLGVAGLTIMAYLGGETLRRRIASGKFIFWGGVIFPLVTVTALLVYGLMLTGARVMASSGDALRIQGIRRTMVVAGALSRFRRSSRSSDRK